jgi:hypothetical protein
MSRVGASSSTPLANSVKVPQEKISQRAYEKWVQRGRPHGDGVADWLEAEKEVKEEMLRGNATMTMTSQRR